MYNNFDIYPYRRAGKSTTEAGEAKHGWGKKKNKYQFNIPWSMLGQAFTGRWLLLYLTAFFLGRAVLLGELMPFAAAIVAAAAKVTQATNILVLISVIAGLATVTDGTVFIGNALVTAVTYLLLRFIPEIKERQWYVVPGLVFVTVLIVKCSIVAYSTGDLYSYISILFEGVFACLLTIAFMQALPPVWQQTVPGRISGEAVFCMLLLLGGVVAGTGEIAINGVTLRGLVSKFIILFSAFVGGVGLGAASGAVVGVIPGLLYVVAPVIIGAYSFAGLVAGLLRGFGRIGVAAGFLLGNILLSIYITDYGNMLEVMLETAIAAMIFCLMPAGWVESITKMFSLPKGIIKFRRPTLPQSHIKEMAAARMHNWSVVFNELANSFGQISAAVERAQEEHGLEQLFVQVGQKVCDGCALYRTCWEREFYRTYQQILDLLTTVEMYGKLSIDDLPERMKKRCARLKEMAITITCLYDNFKMNNYWQKKLLDSRSLVSEQLKGMSNILINLSEQLEKDLEMSGEIEEAIIKRLGKEGITVNDVFTFHRPDGGVEVALSVPPCGGQLVCQHKVVPLVSAITGQNLVLANTGCCLQEKSEECTFKLYSSLAYRVSIGCATATRGGSNISGDSYSTVQLRDGKYALLLSDGMGVGYRANAESSSVITLLKHLLESGFEKDMAVKTVNSILVLRSPNESFATVDMAVIDLYSGKTDIIKICACPSYLIRGGEVSIIKSNSLPVGILEDIEVVTQTRNLQSEDILVMLTDGVLDSYQGKGDPEEWLAEMLKDLAYLEPQEIAEVILQVIDTGLKNAQKLSDDMTVLVAKLERS